MRSRQRHENLAAKLRQTRDKATPAAIGRARRFFQMRRARALTPARRARAATRYSGVGRWSISFLRLVERAPIPGQNSLDLQPGFAVLRPPRRKPRAGLSRIGGFVKFFMKFRMRQACSELIHCANVQLLIVEFFGAITAPRCPAIATGRQSAAP